MKNLAAKLLLICTISLFTICIGKANSNDINSNDIPNAAKQSYETSPNTTTPPSSSDKATDLYRLNAGDYLRISVFGVEDLTGEYHIDGKGNITIPLIGEIKAEGLEKLELQKLIADKLTSGEYYNDPKVTVEIIALQPFYILGEVKNPGSYEFQPDLDIFKAIAIAGGYTPRAAKDKIIIIRKIKDKKTRINATEDTPIIPGDSIKVKQRFF